MSSLLRRRTPYRDGTTDIVLEPSDFIARLAALVPPPRVHLTRYHGVIEIEQCVRCGGRLRVIATIEELELIAVYMLAVGLTVRDVAELLRAHPRAVVALLKC